MLLREVAEMLGIDVPMLSKIESGERHAKKIYVMTLVEILSSNNDELMSLWLADQLLEIVENENLALKAISLAEEEVRFKTKKA